MQTFTVMTASGYKVKLPLPVNLKSILSDKKGPKAVAKIDEITYWSGPRSIARCIDVVARSYSIDASDLRGPGRRREYARPRQLAYALAWLSTGKSYPSIGMKFNKDHTTIMYGIKKYGQLMDESEHLRQEFCQLLRLVGGAVPGRFMK